MIIQFSCEVSYRGFWAQLQIASVAGMVGARYTIKADWRNATY